MKKLEHKTAVITGASSGIGRAIALACAREGAHVIANYNRSGDKTGQLVREITAAGGKAAAIQADVSDRDSIERMVRESQAILGHIDIWVNNAGADILTGEWAQLNAVDKLQKLIDVDLKGTIYCCWGIAPHMQARGHGVIINMSWDMALHGFAGQNPQLFAAVKAGITGFSRAFAKTYGPAIRVNVLAPGWIETAFAENVMPSDYYEARVSEIPVGRFGTPEDVAAAAVFLASEDASYMTGEVIRINGGLI